MQCPECQHEMEEGARFCEACGASLDSACPSCGHGVGPRARFCEACGARLVAREGAAPTRLEQMQGRLSIPEPLRHRMENAEQEMAGENRLVTAMFADISGFTALTLNLPNEAVVEKVNQCFKLITDAVYRYEGSINRFIGDCVLALFGAPLTHENDPERAIRAALEVRDGVPGLDLDVSIGINSAMMYFGPIGTPEHQEISAYGPEVIVAQRLQATASAGQILIGKSTHRLTRRLFDFKRQGVLSLKGFEDPVAAHEVLHVAEHPEKLRGIEGLRSRMIGRDVEFTDLRAATERWLAGNGQMACVIGEAGIGKSRMILELKRALIQPEGAPDVAGPVPLSPVRRGPALTGTPPFLVLEGRCVSIGQPVSYWPFLEILRRTFGLGNQDGESEVARKVTSAVTDLFPQNAEEVLPLFGHLLSVRVGNGAAGKLEHLAPEQIRHQTLMRLRDLFETMARRQPLLLILDDLHWADDLSLDLVSLLMDSLTTVPLMLLCVYRPDRENLAWQLSSLARDKCSARHTEITLKQLSGREGYQLVEELLTINNLPPAVKDMIQVRSEGNPFYIEEVVRSLIDQDLVYREGDRWHTRDEAADIDVPDTIQGVVLARVDRLQPEAKTVLQYASVIGRLFKYRLLEQLVGRDREVEKHLRELEDRELVLEERSDPEREYAFKHAFTQEATYQSILERRRRGFHLQAARGIEHLYHERLEEYCEELAHHYSLSDDVGKAVEYLLKAGEKAKRGSANVAAVTHFQRGLVGLKTLPDDARRARQELDLHVALGPALLVTRGWAHPEVQQTYTRARELCHQMGLTRELFWVLRGLWVPYFIGGAMQKAHQLTRQLLCIAEQEQDPTLLLEPISQRAIYLNHLGEYVEARAQAEKGIRLLSNQSEHFLASHAWIDLGVVFRNYLANALWCLGFPDQALSKNEEAITLAQELSHPFSVVYARIGLGFVYRFRRDWQALKHEMEEFISLCDELGFSLFLAWGTILRGYAMAERGELEHGISQMRQGLEISRASGAVVLDPYWYSALVEIYSRAGRVDEGLSALADWAAAVDETGERCFDAELHRLRGKLWEQQSEGPGAEGGGTEAEACYRKAIDVARGQHAKSLELRATVSLSRLLRGKGRGGEACQMLQEIYGWFTEGFDTADLVEARMLLDELG